VRAVDRLEALGEEPLLASYSYLPAARADFLRRLGRTAEARTAYEEALLLSENTVERDFLIRRLSMLAATPAPRSSEQCWIAPGKRPRPASALRGKRKSGRGRLTRFAETNRTSQDHPRPNPR